MATRTGEHHLRADAPRLDERELATILAGLRCWQQSLEGNCLPATWRTCVPDLRDIATNQGSYENLTPGEIDALCERLNLD